MTKTRICFKKKKNLHLRKGGYIKKRKHFVKKIERLENTCNPALFKAFRSEKKKKEKDKQ